jgi:S1 RNA binding domain protein
MRMKLRIHDIVDAEVTRITDFGAFVKINKRNVGLIHISQISTGFVKDINQHIKVGDKLKARVIKIGPGKKIDLSLRGPSSGRDPRNNSKFKSSDFEEKLKKFLENSQQGLADLKKV